MSSVRLQGDLHPFAIVEAVIEADEHTVQPAGSECDAALGRNSDPVCELGHLLSPVVLLDDVVEFDRVRGGAAPAANGDL
ncbi:hypothetical protein AUL38_14350 [Leucobacter sp. G161]|nr:hypothetical protein AUL38_14350 [Leucobacter sp. G161]